MAKKEEIIKDNLRALDYLEGEGLFPHDKRTVVPNTRFLIISYGGTGGDVLAPVKSRLQRELEPDEYKAKVRVLAIDTDETARYEKVTVYDEEIGQNTIKDKERFTADEFFWLDSAPARAAVDNNILDGMDSWLNKELLAEIQSNRTYLDGKGASSTRQVGRLLLSPQITRTNLQSKINTLVHELTDNNMDQLKVFIISGIAGGTGSGIVIDATYLIRYYINQIAALNTRVQYCGFILLPPTGKSQNQVDIEKGNRNGYAALKEIDYFMTLRRTPGQAYEQTFGHSSVRVESNLFETCFLIDGSITNMAFDNARERATEVVTDCVLDMVTSQQAVGANAPQAVDAFMSDASAYMLAMIGRTPQKIAPRDANFIYCVLGHGQTLIPLDLMKGYVAKKVYDKMYAQFRKCENVTDKDVEDFLDKIQCPDDGATPGRLVDERTLRKNIDAETDRIFQITDGAKGGPFYTINLLKDAGGMVAERASNLRSRAMAIRKEERLKLMQVAARKINELNSKTFSVYTIVMKQMAEHLNKAYGIVTHQEETTHSYYFEPIRFGTTDAQSQIVQGFLDRLISQASTKKYCETLVKQMIEHREAWTNTLGEGSPTNRFDAAREIQSFWNRGVTRIVDATLEDYLVKYYTGDPDAKWETLPDGTPTAKADDGMQKAAKAIVNQMFLSGMATPLASINTSILTTDNFNVHRFLLIPQKAPHLKKYVETEIRNQAGQRGIDPATILISESGANDRISCYAQYTCVPAYVLTWVAEAEKNYEARLNDHGVHMSETTGGDNWRSFPNLMNRDIWRMLPDYSTPREAAIADRVGDLFDRAQKLDLTLAHAVGVAGNYRYYEIKLLPDSVIPDQVLFKILDTENDGTVAKTKAQADLDAAVKNSAQSLFEKVDWESKDVVPVDKLAEELANEGVVNFVSKKINPSGTQMAALGEKPEGWDEELAKKLLRKDLKTTDQLRGTILVLEALYPMVESAQARKNVLRDYAKYLTAGLFRKAEGDTMWTYYDENGYEADLVEIPFGVKAAEMAEEYLVFEAFSQKAQEVHNGMEEQLINELTPSQVEIQAADGKERVAKNQKKQAMIAAAAKLAESFAPKFDVKSPLSIVTRQYEKDAAEAGLQVNEIREFYKTLREILANTFATLLMKY